MKLIIFASLFISSLSFACSEPDQKYLYNFLNYKIPPSVWQTVQGSGYKANKSFPVVAVIEKVLNNSYAYYKQDRYDYIDYVNQVQLCVLGSNRLQVNSPEFGSAVVTRTGNGDQAVLSGRWGIFTLRARPEHLVQN